MNPIKTIAAGLAAAFLFASLPATAQTFEVGVKPGTPFPANSRNGSLRSPDYVARTVPVGTAFSYKLGDLFTIPAVLTESKCALIYGAQAIKLGVWNNDPASATTGTTFTMTTTTAGALVNIEGAGTHARKSSKKDGTAGINHVAYGSVDSTASIVISAPGFWMISYSARPIYDDATCTRDASLANQVSFVNPVINNGVPAATMVVQVVDQAAYDKPENGWYYDASQGGRGYAIEYFPASNKIFMGVFGYDAQGRASWSTGACIYDAAAKTCLGTLELFNRGSTLTGGTPAASYTGPLGTFKLTFSDRTAATLEWTGPTVSLTRFALTGATTDPSKQTSGGVALPTGWYWNSATPGSGWFFESKLMDDGRVTLFGVAFMYRADGSQVWYQFNQASTNTLGSPLFENGSIGEFAGGSSMTDKTWTAPDLASGVSRGTMTFTPAPSINMYSIRNPAGASTMLTKFSAQ